MKELYAALVFIAVSIFSSANEVAKIDGNIDFEHAQHSSDSLLVAKSYSPEEPHEAESQIQDSGLLYTFQKTEIIKKQSRRQIDVKTNLLYTAASLLNIEIEVPAGSHWSISAEYIFPWWSWKRKNYFIQTLSGNITGKYWLKPQAPGEIYRGWYGAFYAGGGYYDLEFGSDGYQGEFYIATGLEVGFSHQISKHWRMEYGIGFGYLRTKFRHYLPIDDCKVWQNDGRYTFVGPTRARISIAWTIDFNRKKGGTGCHL